MKQVDLSSLAAEQLVEKFEAIAIAQGDALDHEDMARFKRLYRDMELVNNELKLRGVEARKLLIRLYGHPNLQVQLKAATKTVPVAPEKARGVLERISKSRIPPQYLDATMLVLALDRGTWHPD